jgi:hypothetical protein
MNETARILCAIGSTENTTLKQFLGRLKPECPPWNQIYHVLVELEAQDLITIRRSNGVITALRFTPLGAERAPQLGSVTKNVLEPI